MQRLQAFRFELMPTGEQAHKMRQFAGARRFVYNKALALQQERYRAGEKFTGFNGMSKWLTVWRNCEETPWLADAPRHTSQCALEDLEAAFKKFFKGEASHPRFKRKGEFDGFTFPDKTQIKLDRENGRIAVPKLGWIRYRKTRAVLGEVRRATISLHGGKWFVSILTAREVEQPVPLGPAIGIDVGIARFATISDGSHIDALNSFRMHEKRLAKYQRRMARKVKGSNNWKRAKSDVQRINARIANVRSDFLHKASNTISKNHAMVAVEDLKIRNMSKSASGTIEKPGKQVAQKRGLNKAILDQGWGEFRRQLEYKVAWNGGFFVAVPPHNTSRECPKCHHISADNRKTQSLFACINCGHSDHADVVGAINILGRGLVMLEGQETGDASPGCAGTPDTARIACGGMKSVPSKQEPTEVLALARAA